jgi:hypothetical protein
MANGYTVFFSYRLITDDGKGYGNAIHCNYFNRLYLETTTNKEVNIYFNDVDDFKFLASGYTDGSGFFANRIHVLVQLIHNAPYNSLDDVKPVASNWREYDVTDQIEDYYTGFTVGQLLTPAYLCGSIFKVPIYKYNDVTVMPVYNLQYIDYPGTAAPDALCFGEEQYFIGNVSADAEAIAYTMDLAISLPLNQYNSTTNPTWDSMRDGEVYITEIGLYDSNKNLVAIGKLNDPVPKNSSIARTIVFALDF